MITDLVREARLRGAPAIGFLIQVDVCESIDFESYVPGYRDGELEIPLGDM